MLSKPSVPSLLSNNTNPRRRIVSAESSSVHSLDTSPSRPNHAKESSYKLSPDLFNEIAHKAEHRPLLDTQVYREMIEEALSDSLKTLEKERTTSATRLRSMRSRLEDVEDTLRNERKAGIEETGKARAECRELRKERDKERLKEVSLRAELEGRWREAQESLKRMEGVAQETERERMTDQAAYATNIERLEKELEGARHVLSHLEKDSAGLRRELADAVAAKEVAEMEGSEVRASFEKYRKVVGSVVETSREEKVRRQRRHSSVAHSTLKLRSELDKRHLLEVTTPPLNEEVGLEQQEPEKGELAVKEKKSKTSFLKRIVQSHPR